MKNKGQMGELGMLITVFLTVVVGVILFQAVAQEQGKSIDTTTIQNRTVAAGASGTVITLTDVKSISGVIITNSTGTINASNNLQVPTSNYTIANNQVSNGNLVTTITVLAGPYSYADTNWNISATYAEPLTYISSSSARSITTLIAIFFALGVAIVALTPTLRSGVLDMMKR